MGLVLQIFGSKPSFRDKHNNRIRRWNCWSRRRFAWLHFPKVIQWTSPYNTRIGKLHIRTGLSWELTGLRCASTLIDKGMHSRILLTSSQTSPRGINLRSDFRTVVLELGLTVACSTPWMSMNKWLYSVVLFVTTDVLRHCHYKQFTPPTTPNIFCRSFILVTRC